MLDYILLGALKLLFALYTFNLFNILLWYYALASIVLYIVPLLPIIYINPILKLFLLLWSLLKFLSLLKSLVWPLLPKSILIVLYIVSLPTAVSASSLFSFFSTA